MNLENLALGPGPCSCVSLTQVNSMCPLWSNKDCQWHFPVEISWKPKDHSKWKLRLKVEMPGFFGNSVVPCNVLLEALLRKDVLMKQTHERACDGFLEQMLQMMHDVWEECKWNPTNSEQGLLHGMRHLPGLHWALLTLQCFAGLTSSLVFTL